MHDLTIPIDDDVLAAAEAVAVERKTTLGELVSKYLVNLAQENRTVDARKKLLDLIDSTTGRLDTGYTWNREDAYAEGIERLLSRHEHPDLRSPPQRG